MKSKILNDLEREILLIEGLILKGNGLSHKNLNILHNRLVKVAKEIDDKLNLMAQQISDIHGIAHTIESELVVTHDEPVRVTAKKILERFTSPNEILKDIPWKENDVAKTLRDGPPDKDETVIRLKGADKVAEEFSQIFRDDLYKRMHDFYDGSDRQLKDEE